jgi:hypothetical protein
MSMICALVLLLQEDWKPDASILDGLQAASAVGPYEIRAPKGYEFARAQQAPQGMEGFAWQGPPREDLTRAMVQVALVTPPRGQGFASPEQFLETMLGGVKRRRTDWTQSAVERGKVNGLEFLRVRWSGTAEGRKMQGIMYAARDGDRFLQLATQDIEPHHTEALKLGEATIQTFRKR